MNQKTIIAGIICASLLATAACAADPRDSAAVQPTAAAAADTAPAAGLDAPEQAVPYSIGVRAVVTDIMNDNGQISFEVKPEDGEPIILHLSDATILVDNQSAAPVGVEDIRVGDTVYAYHDIMMTMSIPGQTPALAILTNLGDSVPAALHMPEQVRRNGATASVLCDNGSIWVRTAEETVFTPYRTRQIVTASDIRMGQPFLAWYDVVMESYPAQAVADRVMILPADPEEHELNLVIDGDMVISAKLSDGAVIVPARLTAETLGLTVGYRKENGTAFITIADGSGEISMTLGEDAYSYHAKAGDSTVMSFGAAPYTAPYMDGGDVTWMSAEAFELLGYKVTLTHGSLGIQSGGAAE